MYIVNLLVHCSWQLVKLKEWLCNHCILFSSKFELVKGIGTVSTILWDSLQHNNM